MNQELLTETNSKLLSFCLLLLRCTVGFILFGAGAGKVFSWFGGFGMETTLKYYAESGFSAFWAYISIYTELIGGLLLIVGLLTRPVAIPVFINMLVATITMMPKGFFVGGASYPFSLMISSLIILLSGPMLYSLDHLLFHRRGKSAS